MKVKELIDLLQTHDPDATVVVAGNEGGYNTATQICGFHIVENYYKERWMGAHECAELLLDWYKEDVTHTVPAVLVI